MIALEIVAKDEDGNLYNCNVSTMIDSGSPISLIKKSFVLDKAILPVSQDVASFVE